MFRKFLSFRINPLERIQKIMYSGILSIIWSVLSDFRSGPDSGVRKIMIDKVWRNLKFCQISRFEEFLFNFDGLFEMCIRREIDEILSVGDLFIKLYKFESLRGPDWDLLFQIPVEWKIWLAFTRRDFSGIF